MVISYEIDEMTTSVRFCLSYDPLILDFIAFFKMGNISRRQRIVGMDVVNDVMSTRQSVITRVVIIGVGRFRILGGQGLEYWGAKGVPNSQQAHDVVLTSMRRRYVASTSGRRHVPTRFLINQCQIITLFILKSDNIENSRIEWKGTVLQVPSN